MATRIPSCHQLLAHTQCQRLGLGVAPRSLPRAFAPMPMRTIHSLGELRPRAFSTSPRQPQELTTSTQQPQSQPQPQQGNPPTAKTRSRRSLKWGDAIFASVTLTFGLLLGEVAKFFISPPDVPEPGSEGDENVIAALHAQAAQLPIVKQMAGDPAWESWDAYNTLTAEHRAQHITAGALAGMRGVGGYQRIFYNAATGEFVSVVFFGPGTGSWPGTVHGGMLATILDESCGRAAFRQWGGRPGVTAYLNVQYKRRTAVDGFYVIRVRARDDDALPEKDRGKRNYKSYVDASIEDAVTGYVTVVADALFVGGEGKKTKGKGWGVSWGGTGKAENLQF